MSKVEELTQELNAIKPVYFELRQLAHENPGNLFTQELFRTITNKVLNIKAELKENN